MVKTLSPAPRAEIAEPPAPPSEPYVGPRPVGQGEVLYGRDHELAALVDLVIAKRIVLLYSPSGAGKTSLVNAGVIPALEAEGFRVLPVIRVNQEPPPEDGQTAGTAAVDRYTLSALQSLEAGVPEAQRLPLSELSTLSLAGYLDGCLDRLGAGVDDPLVLLFDQFEEVLTANPIDVEAKHAFFEGVG